MERLTQLLSMLAGAPGRTLSIDELLDTVRYGGTTPENRRDQLRRDVAHLESLGWQITNVAAEGEPARYRLTAVDNRLRVEFTPQQRAELLRAAAAASLADLFDDLGDDTTAAVADLAVQADTELPQLATVHRAVAGHCLLRFTYKGRSRRVHPHALHAEPGGWYLTAEQDDDSAVVKTFVVARMSDLAIDAPGTARVPDRPARPDLDPIRWAKDPAVDVTVRTTVEHADHVESMLGRAASVEQHGSEVVLTIPVTHRQAFRQRLYELGSRVLLLGPDDVRDEVRRELQAVVAGEAS
jgi:predicted DNA-binding transcriptional regulator YafY